MERNDVSCADSDPKAGILLVGCGGHCRSVLDSLLRMGSHSRIGITAKDADEMLQVQKDPLLSPYLVGCDADLPRLFGEGWTDAFVALGSVGSTMGRQRIALKLKEVGFRMPAIVDPSAVLAGDVVPGEGVFVGKRAVVNAGASVAPFAILNTGSVVEHDCRVGAFAHVSPGAILCGQVSVGAYSHVGAGSVVRQQIRIGERVLIGAGSVVVKDIPDAVTAYGNPCRLVDKR